MTADYDTRYYKNRANRADEIIENLKAEVAHLTAVVDRVRELRDRLALKASSMDGHEHCSSIVADLDEALDGEVTP